MNCLIPWKYDDCVYLISEDQSILVEMNFNITPSFLAEIAIIDLKCKSLVEMSYGEDIPPFSLLKESILNSLVSKLDLKVVKSVSEFGTKFYPADYNLAIESKRAFFPEKSNNYVLSLWSDAENTYKILAATLELYFPEQFEDFLFCCTNEEHFIQVNEILRQRSEKLCI